MVEAWESFGVSYWVYMILSWMRQAAVQALASCSAPRSPLALLTSSSPTCNGYLTASWLSFDLQEFFYVASIS